MTQTCLSANRTHIYYITTLWLQEWWSMFSGKSGLKSCCMPHSTTWLAVHTSVRMKVSITANCKNIWRQLWGHLYSWWKHCAVIGAALPGALYSSARAYHCKWHSSGEDTRSFKARRTGDLSCQRKTHKLQAQCFAVTCRYTRTLPIQYMMTNCLHDNMKGFCTFINAAVQATSSTCVH